jgi:hypothetical protein
VFNDLYHLPLVKAILVMIIFIKQNITMFDVIEDKVPMLLLIKNKAHNNQG